MAFPLFLTLTGRLCVVVGGGAVGRRKAAIILDAGGRVRLVCHEPRPASVPEGELEWLAEAYEPRHLDGASLVFAAATAAVNRRVAADAHARGLWVNRADEPEAGDFILPAVLRRGELTLAVSTGGASPVLAQEIRNHLEGQFDQAFGDWVALLAELRAEVLERVGDAGRRRDVFARLCRWEWLDRLRREGPTQTRAAMRQELEGLFAADANRL